MTDTKVETVTLEGIEGLFKAYVEVWTPDQQVVWLAYAKAKNDTKLKAAYFKAYTGSEAQKRFAAYEGARGKYLAQTGTRAPFGVYARVAALVHGKA